MTDVEQRCFSVSDTKYIIVNFTCPSAMTMSLTLTVTAVAFCTQRYAFVHISEHMRYIAK